MEQFRGMLLNAWREACRHIRIEESTQRIAELLATESDIQQVVVRRVLEAEEVIETVAVGPADAISGRFDRNTCSKPQLDAVMEWCRHGSVMSIPCGEVVESVAEVIVPSGIDREVICVPLNQKEGDPGLLVLVAGEAGGFDSRHMRLAEALQEPFSAAMDNDGAIRELEILRKAAEAEKQSLLVKLGRSSLAGAIVGAQTGLRSVMKRVEQVAGSNVPVLIFGETGSGKEVIARAIHQRSTRSEGAFVRVNCGAIPPELVDSELFGHEKGAFTGAVASRKGWFERADGGTLFLDEIGELPPAAQVRLLRILQDGWLERVGGHSAIHVDVRIVAATNRDLAGMVAQRQFREDLWYRIAVFPVVLPPLRERKGDIRALAEHFSQKAARKFGLLSVEPTVEDVRLLESYDWPGNVREFAAVIDRAAILGDGRRLEIAKSLGLQDTRATVAVTRPPVDTAEKADQGSAIGSLDAAMREHIEKALLATRGRIEGPFGAAALLEINPHTLRGRMRKLRIDGRRFRPPDH